jgi:AbrB family looped-hinge helix DNA binding protein
MVEPVNMSSTFAQKVKSQGRIVIPKIVRDGLKIATNDIVVVTVRKREELPNASI